MLHRFTGRITQAAPPSGPRSRTAPFRGSPFAHEAERQRCDRYSSTTRLCATACRARACRSPRRRRCAWSASSTSSASTSSRRASRAPTRRSSSSSRCSPTSSSIRPPVCAFGMTRRRDTEAAEDEALRLLASGFAPVVTPGRQDLGPAPREGHQGEPRGEPGDDPRLDRLPGRGGQARDLRRRALLRRLPRRRRATRSSASGGRGRRGRRERHALRHERLQPAGAGRRGDHGDGRCARRRRSAFTPTTTWSARSRTRWPPSSRGRASCRAR